MGEEQSEGLDTKKFCSSGKAFESAKSSILGHFSGAKGKKKGKQVCGIAAIQELRYLNYPPQTAGPLWTVGPSGLRRSSLPFSSAARV